LFFYLIPLFFFQRSDLKYNSITSFPDISFFTKLYTLNLRSNKISHLAEIANETSVNQL